MTSNIEHLAPSVAHVTNPPRSVGQAMLKGARSKCPSCGKGSLFRRYLKVADTCNHCSEELHHQRADDAPPYLTIFLVGHILLPLVLWVEMTMHPALWIHAVMWIPLTVALSMLCLSPIKGAVVGLQWALYMHGFDPAGSIDDPRPKPV